MKSILAGLFLFGFPLIIILISAWWLKNDKPPTNNFGM